MEPCGGGKLLKRRHCIVDEVLGCHTAVPPANLKGAGAKREPDRSRKELSSTILSESEGLRRF